MFRRPFTQSLEGEPHGWEAADEQLRDLLRQALGEAGDLEIVSGHSVSESAYARCSGAGTAGNLFLKIVPRQLARRLERARAISEHLRRCGVATPVCLSGFPRELADGRSLFAYPFESLNPVRIEREGSTPVARAVAALHDGLESFSGRDRVLRRQRRMRAAMRRTASALLATKHWAQGPLAPAREHLRNWIRADEAIERSSCQVIHNDLNAGNLLVDGSGAIVILDLEEAVWSFLPVELDLAKVVERFVLVRSDMSRDEKRDSVRELLAVYRDARGSRENGAPFSLRDALRWSLGFSWMRMWRLLEIDGAEEHGEVRKFLTLGVILDEEEELMCRP